MITRKKGDQHGMCVSTHGCTFMCPCCLRVCVFLCLCMCVCVFHSYLIAGTDVHTPLQELQDLVDVSRPCRPKEAGIAVRLEDRTEKAKIVRPQY